MSEITEQSQAPPQEPHFSGKPSYVPLDLSAAYNAAEPKTAPTFIVRSLNLPPKPLSGDQSTTRPKFQPPKPPTKSDVGLNIGEYPALGAPRNALPLTAPSTKIWTGANQYAPKNDKLPGFPTVPSSPSSTSEWPYGSYQYDIGKVGSIIRKAFGLYYVENPCKICRGNLPTVIHDTAIQYFVVLRRKCTLLPNRELPTCTKHRPHQKGHSNHDCWFYEHCDHPQNPKLPGEWAKFEIPRNEDIVRFVPIPLYLKVIDFPARRLRDNTTCPTIPPRYAKTGIPTGLMTRKMSLDNNIQHLIADAEGLNWTPPENPGRVAYNDENRMQVFAHVIEPPPTNIKVQEPSAEPSVLDGYGGSHHHKDLPSSKYKPHSEVWFDEPFLKAVQPLLITEHIQKLNLYSKTSFDNLRKEGDFDIANRCYEKIWEQVCSHWVDLWTPGMYHDSQDYKKAVAGLRKADSSSI